MTNTLSSSSSDSSRKVIADRRSRRGCGNCKIRKVKVFGQLLISPHLIFTCLQCDESKPSCTKCTKYGVYCDYDSQHAPLQFAAHGAGNVLNKSPVLTENLPCKGTFSTALPLTLVQQPDLNIHSYTDRALLDKFLHRTVPTISFTATERFYQKEVILLAYFVCHPSPQPPTAPQHPS